VISTSGATASPIFDESGLLLSVGLVVSTIETPDIGGTGPFRPPENEGGPFWELTHLRHRPWVLFVRNKRPLTPFAEIRKHREGYPMLLMILSVGLSLAIGLTIHVDMAAARERGRV
jgi:hypothetical protein